MSDILLINPPTGDKKPIQLASPPHLGLAAIAAVAVEAGYSVSVLDFGFNRYDKQQLRTRLLAEQPKIAGVSVVSPSLRQAYGICRDVKEISPETVLVAGGPHVSADRGIITEFSADYGFVGEAERGFKRLCDFVIRDTGELSVIPGLVHQKNKGLASNTPDFIEDLDELPDPLISPHCFSRNESIPVAASRGCPFECTYCTQAACMKVRFRSIENVISEMLSLSEKHGKKMFSFVDDVFTLERERSLGLCNLIKKEIPGARFSIITRADYVDKELLAAMKGAGCFHVSFGVESGVEEVRRRLNKNVSNKDYVKAFGLCNSLGLRTSAYAMYGLPGETWGDMQETTSFIKRLHPTYGFFKTTVLMPGSKLFSDAESEGKVGKDAWHNFMKEKEGMPHYVPDGMTLKDVEFARTRAVKSFYISGGFARDHMRLGCGVAETIGLARLAHTNPDCFS